MKYGFSSYYKAFYLLQSKEDHQRGGTWSDDIIPVSDATWAEYSCPPPKGKILGANEHNLPCWIVAPAASLSEKQASANEQRMSGMVVAEDEINKLNIVRSVYKLTLDEEGKLAMWKKYYADLYRLNTDEPDGVCWPVPPDI